jgi:hypothetical protein
VDEDDAGEDDALDWQELGAPFLLLLWSPPPQANKTVRSTLAAADGNDAFMWISLTNDVVRNCNLCLQVLDHRVSRDLGWCLSRIARLLRWAGARLYADQ